MSDRHAKVTRSTEKSEVEVVFDLDGSGLGVVQTGVPLLDQMLLLFARQGGFNLDIRCQAGDATPGEILEEVALCLGLALDKALGQKQKIACSGLCFAPVAEHLARVVVEISGHPCLVYRVPSSGGIDAELVETFWRALVSQARLTLHIELLYGGEGLPAFDAIFKAAARALCQACAITR